MDVSIQPIPDGHVTMPQGFLAGAVAAGIKTKPGVLDLALLVSDRDCAVGGVFTRNLVRSAPVDVTEARVATGVMRGIVVNAGNANALTGEPGIADAEAMAAAAAAHVAAPEASVGVASTGVTGVPLPLDKVRAGIPRIELTRDGGADFARAIMTTDTFAKEYAVRVTAGDETYTIAGCCKGSGMIHPDMATMLAYVTTDAAIEPATLQRLVRETADVSFNMVTVDGDTSCSDTFLVFANGAAGYEPLVEGTERYEAFRAGFEAVSTHLAREIARDGEGASHLIEVVVTGAESVSDARLIAKTIALSSLVKTAVAGTDPNWGRILVAAGRAGARIDPARASLSVQGFSLYDSGRIVKFDEAAVSGAMEAPEVRIELDLALGEPSATAWGCDLTVDYVHINADYRT